MGATRRESVREERFARTQTYSGFQLLWEPRYGDVAGTGELGYLTGPSRSILPSRNKGQPRHSVYASVWKRERDGTFRVVMDVGVPTPRLDAFPAGFTRAPHGNRFTGDYDDRIPPLGNADGVMNSALRSSQVRAYRGQLAPGARLHRPNLMPVTGEANILKWLATQPSFASAQPVAESALLRRPFAILGNSHPLSPKLPPGWLLRAGVAREQSGQWKWSSTCSIPDPRGS